MTFKRVLAALFSFFLLVVFLIWFTGLGHYFLIVNAIRGLGSRYKENATQEFYAEGKSDKVVAGTLAMIVKSNNSKIYLWSNNKLKSFWVDKHTTYFYYDICSVMGKSSGEGFDIGSDSKILANDLDEWNSFVGRGSFVQLSLDDSAENEQAHIREIRAYSHPLFLPLPMDYICEN